MGDVDKIDWENGVYAKGTREWAFQKHYLNHREICEKYKSDLLTQKRCLDCQCKPYEDALREEMKRFKEELKEIEKNDHS